MKPLSELNNQILLDEASGQIFSKGAVLKLNFPMLLIRHGQTDGNKRLIPEIR